MLCNELFESVIRESREAHSHQLFESVLREADEPEMVIVEAGRIFITQTDKEKLKSIDELWDYYKDYAEDKIKTNKNGKKLLLIILNL